ncbi:MAG: OmpA family protein [Acidimicrobiales bacterium]
MAELFEEVVTLLESRSCTRALASQFRIESEQAASNGAVLGVPIFLARLGEWASDSARSVTVLKTLRSIETGGLQDPGATVEARLYDPVGSELANTLLGDGRQKVSSVISGEAGISERSAAAMLAPTAWAVVASIADRYGSRVDRQSLIAILKKEEADLIEGGWGPWLDATSPEPIQQPAQVASQQASPANLDPGGQATGNYPPPVARSARLVDDEPAAPARPRSQLANGRGPTVTGPVSHRRTPASSRPSPERRRDPEVGSRLPAILGILALFLLGAGAIYLLLRDGDDAADETAAISAEDSSEGDGTADDGAVVLSEPVAIDVVMYDPQGRSESTGVAELRFQPETGEICYNVNAELIGSPYDGHIHVGPAGVKGGIVVDFGPLNNADIGCTTVSTTELATILDDQSGHYVEMHDPSGDFTIRAQLSDAMPDDVAAPSETPAEDLLFDPTSGGASTVIESGRVILRGEVADQETFDRLVAENADVAGAGLELVNELTIVEGAPVPSGLITIDDSILFDVNSDQLAGGSTAVADLATLLTARPDWTVTVVGHTDSTGGDVYNLELSLRRANAVVDELVANGVASERLKPRGDGANVPVGDNATPEGRALNRRIEFIIDRG